jgi:hypothetical protein
VQFAGETILETSIERDLRAMEKFFDQTHGLLICVSSSNLGSPALRVKRTQRASDKLLACLPAPPITLLFQIRNSRNYCSPM